MENLYLFNLESGEYAATMPYNNEPIPENGTLKKVPKTETNQVAVFNKDLEKWEVKADYRFTHKMIDSDNNLEHIEEIGEIPAGYTLITNEQAEKIEAKIKIEKLTMTPLDFIGVLQSFGLTLQQINLYLESHLEIKMQLTYCNSVYCGVAKNLMPITFENVTITAEMVEHAFKVKYGIV